MKILHLGSFERPDIISFKKYNYMFSTPVAMETIQDGRQTTFLKIPTPPKIMHIEQNCLLNFKDTISNFIQKVLWISSFLTFYKYFT